MALALERRVDRDLAVRDGHNRGPALAGIAAGTDIEHARVRVLELRRKAFVERIVLHQHAPAVAKLFLAAIRLDDLQRNRADRHILRLCLLGMQAKRRESRQRKRREKRSYSHGRAAFTFSS